MSMRDYAVEEYGMVIDRDTAKEMCYKLFEDYDCNNGDDPYYDIYNQGLCEYISDFTGEAFELYGDGRDDWSGESHYYNCESLSYIPLSAHSTLFKGAYGNMNDIITELKDKVGEYLPDDFDYRSRIRHIVGTYFG